MARRQSQIDFAEHIPIVARKTKGDPLQFNAAAETVGRLCSAAWRGGSLAQPSEMAGDLAAGGDLRQLADRLHDLPPHLERKRDHQDHVAEAAVSLPGQGSDPEDRSDQPEQVEEPAAGLPRGGGQTRPRLHTGRGAPLRRCPTGQLLAAAGDPDLVCLADVEAQVVQRRFVANRFGSGVDGFLNQTPGLSTGENRRYRELILTWSDRSWTMAAVSVVRSAALRGFRATAAELGGNADRLATVVGLPDGALDADDQLVPVEVLVALLEFAAAELDCPDLGLRLAARQDIGTLGPLALAMRASATVGEAFECVARYLLVHSRTVTLTLVPDPDDARGVVALRYDISGGSPVTNQGIDLGMGFVHRAITELVGGSYGLRSVDLPYRPGAPIATYESFFGAPVRIDRPVGLLRLPASVLRQPLKGGANPYLRQLAEAFLAELLPEHTSRATAPRVQVAIEQILGTAPVTITTVAAMLSMHPRTLQRRLAAENTAFATLLDDVRRHAARRYLATTDMPLAQVAALLGLSEQAVLTHLCRRWWSATPTGIRGDSALAR